MSKLPEVVKTLLCDTLRGLGDQTDILSVRMVVGGCINNAVCVRTAHRAYFLKWNNTPLPGMFECEARGLALLAATNTVRVPSVLYAAEANGQQPAFILQEWIESGENDDQSSLGEQLAALHLRGISPMERPAYGLDHDNYIGLNRQINRWEVDWPLFYLKYRIQPQVEVAIRNNLLSPDHRRRLERLMNHLPDLLGGVDRRPALIHGDLWIGNVISGPQGFAVIDPAVSYSDREAEIAFTELFGGFNQRFYAAYNSVWPLDPAYHERRDLYNLYHLLNHLNLFGEPYTYQIDAVLRKYVR